MIWELRLIKISNDTAAYIAQGQIRANSSTSLRAAISAATQISWGDKPCLLASCLGTEQTGRLGPWAAHRNGPVKISLKIVANGSINNIPALLQIMAWHRLVRRQAIVWTNDGCFNESNRKRVHGCKIVANSVKLYGHLQFTWKFLQNAMSNICYPQLTFKPQEHDVDDFLYFHIGWSFKISIKHIDGGPIQQVLCNIGYPSETHLELKSHEISLVHNIRFKCLIDLKFCTGHGSDTAVLCAKFQGDGSTEAFVMGKRDFARFEFKMNFGRISYIAHGTTDVSSRTLHDFACTV